MFQRIASPVVASWQRDRFLGMRSTGRRRRRRRSIGGTARAGCSRIGDSQELTRTLPLHWCPPVRRLDHHQLPQLPEWRYDFPKRWGPLTSTLESTAGRKSVDGTIGRKHARNRRRLDRLKRCLTKQEKPEQKSICIEPNTVT